MIKSGAAIIGCGNISAIHLNAIKNMGLTPITLFDTKPERARDASARFGGTVASSFEEAITNPEVTHVHILTPHAFHTEQTLAALKANKYVVCEKPMSTTIDGAKRMIEADPDGTRLCVIFQNRYNPSSVAARRIVRDEVYGRLKGIRAQVTWKRGEDYYNDDWHGTQSLEGGGALINQAIHTLDLLLHLGGKPAEIKGSVTTDLLQGKIEVEENAHAVVRFESGATGIMYASNSNAIDALPEIELAFERGLIRIVGDDLIRISRDGFEKVELSETDAPKLGKNVYGSSHAIQIREFYEASAAGKSFTIGAREAYDALWAVLSIYESSRTNEWVGYR